MAYGSKVGNQREDTGIDDGIEIDNLCHTQKNKKNIFKLSHIEIELS